MSKNIRDMRMNWIILMDECDSKNSDDFHYYEYELCSEVRIPGGLEYGNGALYCGLLEEKNKEGLYTYKIMVKEHKQDYTLDKNQYSAKGYYFKDGFIGELLSIFSVYFQARFFLKSSTFHDKSPTSWSFRNNHEFHYQKPKKLLNYEMFTDQDRNWAHEDGLTRFLDKLRLCPSEYHQDLIRAFFWYNEAIKEIGIDEELFYIKMTSCIETLLRYIDLDPDSLEKRLQTLLSSNSFDKRENTEVRNWIDNRRIKMKFMSFMVLYSKGFFKGGRIKAKKCHIYKNDLEKFAGRIYDARSGYLHRGEPMYLSMPPTSLKQRTWDLDPTLGMMMDRRSFSPNKKLPLPRWFERLVHHCLIQFIEANFTPPPSP